MCEKKVEWLQSYRGNPVSKKEEKRKEKSRIRETNLKSCNPSLGEWYGAKNGYEG